jgi:diguanylate cyclase (GGDEF)-like protein
VTEQQSHALNPQPITPAFIRRVRQTMGPVVLVAIVVFAITSAVLLSAHARELPLRQARLCAIALRSAPPNAMADSIRTLIANDDQLIGVARLSPAGHALAFYPDEPGIRRAVHSALQARSFPARVEVGLQGGEQRAWGVVQPIDGVDGPYGRRVVLFFKRDSYAASWLSATCFFGLFMGTAVYLGVRWMVLWFERQVADPLRNLCGARETMGRKAGKNLQNALKGWHETLAIAEHFRALDKEVADSRARLDRLGLAFETLLRQHEYRFHRKLRRAKDEAKTDALTRLRNRRYLDDELEHLFEEQRSQGRDLAVVMLDLDNFKQHNDVYGHQAGDELLIFVGELLRASIRPEDIAIRYGGDEFVLLLPDATAEQAQLVADRIVRLFAQYSSRLPSPRSVTMSAGVASLVSTGCDAGRSLVNRADEALYRAKGAGKDAVVPAATK